MGREKKGFGDDNDHDHDHDDEYEDDQSGVSEQVIIINRQQI